MKRRRATTRDDSATTLLALLVGGGAVAAAAALLLRDRNDNGRAVDRTGEPVGGDVVTDDVEALARVIASEAGSTRYSDEERRAIAWTVRNRARRRKTTIARLVCQPCGPCCRGRPFSSARPATDAARRLAKDVLAEPLERDPTQGARAFFEPAVQDRLVAERRPGYRFTSAALRAKWSREGQRYLSTVGAFEFWA